MPPPDTFIGIDLGTSSLKGVAASSEGVTIASARASYPTQRPALGRAEQDPADWTVAFREVIRALAATVPQTSWAGIGLSGMIPTLVPIDANGSARMAITWEDARAEAEGEELRSSFGADALYARTGQWVDGRYLLPMYRWIERHDQGTAAETEALLGAKDYLFSWLTGERVTDPSTATGFGCFDLTETRWIDGLLPDVALPDIRKSSFSAEMRDAVADELEVPRRIPVTLGAADSVSAALGVGATEPGDCAYVWGTSTVVLGVAEDARLDPAHRFLVTPLALGDAFGLEMDLLSTGAAFGWTAGVFGVDGPSELLRLAERSSPGANGVTFLPYLAFGEQGALWDPALRGALDGLTIAHTREDIARALVEAIVVESRRAIGVLAEASASPREIRVTGAIAEEPFFLRELASATDRAVVAVEHPSAAAAGAAAIASGKRPTAHRAPNAIEPETTTTSFWDERQAEIDDLRGRLRRDRV
ncbi:MAG: FGGY-family carbohydrate kinase [Actinomycetota bacterium]